MKIIHKYKQFNKALNKEQTCIGIRLFRRKRLNIELWFCPPGFCIIPHTHNLQDIELIFLYGEALFVRNKMLGNGDEKFYVTCPKHMFRKFTISRGIFHWFEVSQKWLVFLNIERWLTDRPTSASVDFHPVTVPSQKTVKLLPLCQL